MRTSTKVLAAIAIFAVLVGGILCWGALSAARNQNHVFERLTIWGSDGWLSGWKFGYFSNEGYYSTPSKERAEFDAAKVSSIRIDVINEDIEIITGGDMVRVDYQNRYAGDYTVKLSDSGELRIEWKDKVANIFNLNDLAYPKRVITVTLPEGYVTQNLRIDAVSGKVEMDALVVGEEVSIDVVSGNIISYDKIVAHKIDIDCVSGSFRADYVETSEFNFNAVSGSVNIDRLAGRYDDYAYKFSTVSGRLRINSDVFNGDVNLNNITAGKRIDIDTVSGSCNITTEK